MNRPTARSRRRHATLRHLAAGLVAALSIAGVTALGQGDRFPSMTRWQLAWHGGSSLYIGDQEAMRLDQPALGAFGGGELVHQFTPAVGLGVAAQIVRNPRLDEPDSYRSTLSALLRLTQPGSRRLSPYLQTGILYIIGASRGGSGPLAGVGFNVRVARTFSVFAEGNLQLVYPGDVLDGSQTADHFDGIGLVGVGIRISDLRGFFGRRPALEILAIRHAPAPEQELPVRFDADLNIDNTGARVVWTFGDGETRTGNPVQYTFRNAGIHEVVATATSNGGTAVHYLIIDVAAKEPPAVVTATRRESAPSTRPDTPPVRQDREEITRPSTSGDERPERTEDEQPEPKVTRASPQTAPADPPEERAPLPFSGYTWVIGSTASLSEARTLAATYSTQGNLPLIFPHAVDGITRYRVTLGQFGSRSQAQRGRSALPATVPKDTWLAFVDAQPPLRTGAGPDTPERVSRVSPPPANQRPSTESRSARFTWVVASATSMAAAETLAERLRAEGHDASVRSSLIGGTTRYRVSIGGYASRSEAQADRGRLPADLREEAWLLDLESER